MQAIFFIIVLCKTTAKALSQPLKSVCIGELIMAGLKQCTYLRIKGIQFLGTVSTTTRSKQRVTNVILFTRFFTCKFTYYFTLFLRHFFFTRWFFHTVFHMINHVKFPHYNNLHIIFHIPFHTPWHIISHFLFITSCIWKI